MAAAPTANEALICQSVREAGFAFADHVAMRDLLEKYGGLDDWAGFAASWNDLGIDTYLASVGLNRSRRHAVFSTSGPTSFRRAPDQPHYQSRAYNQLQGDIERWFEPIAPTIADSVCLRSILRCGISLFGQISPSVASWRIEVHQFRIEAHAGAPGQPTPEGIHRDGVTHVLVVLVDRRNLRRGTTCIHAADGRALGRFTLSQPLDAAWLDDTRVYHGVTAVAPVVEDAAAHRDVLVVTFRDTDSAPR
ncbi:MAG: 2OG-Fe dioxygenase family protein [Lysobacter sp.]